MVSARVYYEASLEALVVDLDGDYEFLSTIPYQPRVANSIVFKRVPEDFQCSNLRGYYEGVRRELGRMSSIVFLTSAQVEDYIYESRRDEKALIVATLGLKPPVCPGYESLYRPLSGTINVAVVVDYDLAYSAMADLLRVVAEAKALACSELLLRCARRSPGTVTDAIAVGRPTRGEEGIVAAGMATEVGGWVAEVIYRRFVEVGLRKLSLEGFLENALGLTLDDLANLAIEAYTQAPIPGVDLELVRGRVRRLLERLLNDPNVTSFIVAARELDLHASSGSIPGLRVEDHERDSTAIVADELLAFSLSLYIAGFKGLLATYWVERLKERGSLKVKLPQFEDDVVAALVGSTLSLLYSELLGGS